MYWRHFNLTAEPFSLTPDPSFLYLSPVHAEAFAAMTMGLRERRGLITTIGEVGTGKTTLVYSLLSGLGPEIHTAYISNARLSFDGILRLALRDFGVPCDSANNADLLDAFNKFLLDCATQGTTAALVIDEAQNLSQETFEDLRLLSNFETYTHKLLQIVLVGQPELDAKLREPSLRQVAERVAVRCVVNPLSRSQSRQYLEHRLAAVNGSLSLFTASALRLLIATSRGIPRSLNILAHNAMLFAYGEESHRVERRYVAAAVREKEGNTIVRLWRRPKRAPAVRSSAPAKRRDLRSLWALGGAAVAGLTVGLVIAGTDWGSGRGRHSPAQAKPSATLDSATAAVKTAPVEPARVAPTPQRRTNVGEEVGAVADEAAVAAPAPVEAVPVAAAPTVPAAVALPTAVEPIVEAAPAVAAPAAAAVPTPSALAPAPTAAPIPVEPVAVVVPVAPAAVVAAEPSAPPLVAEAPAPVVAPPASAVAPPPAAVVSPVVVTAPTAVVVPPATVASAPAAAATVTRAAATRTTPPPARRAAVVPSKPVPVAPPAAPSMRVATRSPAPVTPPPAAPAADVVASAAAPDTVVTVPAGSSLSDLMLAVYGQYNSQMMERVQAVNPQVTDPDVIITGDRLRFPDKASAIPSSGTEAR